MVKLFIQLMKKIFSNPEAIFAQIDAKLIVL